MSVKQICDLPQSGRIEKGLHRFPVRVYYEDTDNAQIVYHANYLKFAERARTEILRLVGLEQTELSKRFGLFFAVKDCFVTFARPARLDDLLEVRSRITVIKGASLSFEQVIMFGDAEIARCDIRIACVDERGGPARIPAEVRQAFTSILGF
ncbi:tol-pal system-associated acyl-CoA thioesterase [Kiloniella laminariae]|uniref:tol-pal system-associated acyl-CoA thioesterase n=1 Tax=Kiloniella laminariae TaxID=454162 RepID=UPI000367BA7D|nr:tol-pal system-associated acyl-CoA thioesterase [Kiloniella laminariae]